MAYSWQMEVRFRHCDPAGIVFYPRYFEMANDLVETFFADAVQWPFHRMHGPERLGVPMGEISARFARPSRVGDRLDWRLVVTRLGGASATLAMQADCAGELRLHLSGTIVLVNLDSMTSRRWPDDIRARLAPYVKETAA